MFFVPISSLKIFVVVLALFASVYFTFIFHVPFFFELFPHLPSYPRNIFRACGIS
jgi:hypothetical protein